jgi:hypothetical protein
VDDAVYRGLLLMSRVAALHGLQVHALRQLAASRTLAMHLNWNVFVLLLQAVAYRGCFPDASPLISMAAALLDLQHYCPALLAAAADAALQQGGTPTSAAAEQGSQQEQQQQQQGDDADSSSSSSSSSLAPEEVVSLLLALGFFRVRATDFVESALEVRPGQQQASPCLTCLAAGF